MKILCKMFIIHHSYVYAKLANVQDAYKDSAFVLNTIEKTDLNNRECLLAVIKRKRNDMAKKIEMNQEMLPPGTSKTFVFEQHKMKSIELKTLQHLKRPMNLNSIVGNICFFYTTVQYLFAQPILFSLLVENYMYNDFSVLFLNFYLKSVVIVNEMEKLRKSDDINGQINVWVLKEKINCIIDGFFTLCGEINGKWKNSNIETYFKESNEYQTINCVLHLLLHDFYRIKSIDGEIFQKNPGNVVTNLMPYLNITNINDWIGGNTGIIIYFLSSDKERNIQNILDGKNSSTLRIHHNVLNYDDVLFYRPHWLQIEILKKHYGSDKKLAMPVKIPLNLRINDDEYELTAFCCVKIFPEGPGHVWAYCKYADNYYKCNNQIINAVTDDETLQAASYSSKMLLYTKIT